MHLSFALDGSGLVNLVKAEVTLELPADPEPVAVANSTSVAETAASNTTEATEEATTTSTADEPSATAANTTEPVDTSANSTDSTNGGSESKPEPKKDTKEKGKDKGSKKPKDKFLRKILVVTVNPSVTVPARWTPTMIEEARQKGLALKALDDLRKGKMVD